MNKKNEMCGRMVEKKYVRIQHRARCLFVCQRNIKKSYLHQSKVWCTVVFWSLWQHYSNCTCDSVWWTHAELVRYFLLLAVVKNIFLISCHLCFHLSLFRQRIRSMSSPLTSPHLPELPIIFYQTDKSPPPEVLTEYLVFHVLITELFAALLTHAYIIMRCSPPRHSSLQKMTLWWANMCLRLCKYPSHDATSASWGSKSLALFVVYNFSIQCIKQTHFSYWHIS